MQNPERGDILNVCHDILNQENHHKKKTFRQEYLEFLKKFEVKYDAKYLFEWYDSLSALNATPAGFTLSYCCFLLQL